MSGSSSVVSLLPRGAVPYCSTWCSLCCLAAQPRRLQLLVTGSASSPLRRPSPSVFVSWRRLSMVSNALLFFYICSFLLLRAACTSFADAPQRPRRRLILHAYAYPWRAPRARPPPNLPLRGSNSRPPAPIPGDQGFAFGDTAPWFYLGAVPPPSLC